MAEKQIPVHLNPQGSLLLVKTLGKACSEISSDSNFQFIVLKYGAGDLIT